jgi:hypothetical protein
MTSTHSSLVTSGADSNIQFRVVVSKSVHMRFVHMALDHVRSYWGSGTVHVLRLVVFLALFVGEDYGSAGASGHGGEVPGDG